MHQNYSSEDLILYLYNEAGMTHSVLIQKALDSDDELSDEYRQLVWIKDLLEPVCAPAPERVESLMAYSRLAGYLA
jgi:hypothetical protein